MQHLKKQDAFSGRSKSWATDLQVCIKCRLFYADPNPSWVLS